VERLVAKRFTRHTNLHTLFPAQQSTYRPFHSTGTDHQILLRVLSDRSASAALLSTGFSHISASRLSHSSMPVTPQIAFPLHAVYHMGPFLDLLNLLHTPRTSLSWPKSTSSTHIRMLTSDDTQLYDSSTLVDADSGRDHLTGCVSDVAKWCASHRLQPNADKTDTIWFGSRSNLAKLQHINQSLQASSSNIQPSSVVCDLGVYLDSELIHTSSKPPPPASTTFVICVRSVVRSARKLHSSWSWRS